MELKFVITVIGVLCLFAAGLSASQKVGAVTLNFYALGWAFLALALLLL